jgi:Domain of unknown function (DUF222)
LRYGSTGDWLTHLGGLRRGEGRRVLRRAVALTGPLTATRTALAAGELSDQQADVITRSIAALPGDLGLRARAERLLVDQARSLDATDLAHTAAHLVSVVDPDRAERRTEAALDRQDRAAHTDRYLALSDDGAGGIRLQGRGSLEDGALLRAALLPTGLE